MPRSCGGAWRGRFASNDAPVNTASVARALAGYDRSRLTLCSIGSHSALEVAYGARAQGLRNLVVTAKGRERTYTEHFAGRANPARGCVDAVVELDSFAGILRDEIQRELLNANVIFVPNRSFEVYLRERYTYDEIERRMRVPFFGNRSLLKAEERDAVTLSLSKGQGDSADQYALLERAGIRHPRRFAAAQEIDRLVIVKAAHARVSFERAFFLASSPREYDETAARLIDERVLTPEALATARIEEYALGPSVNLNFFFSPLIGELELMGTDTRRQTNLEGFRNVPPSAFDAVRGVGMRMEEAGHVAATILESMLEPAFAMGERFVRATRELQPPGIIGPFALQCVVTAGPPKELVCYDVSLRIPGSPGTRYTPYSAYRWGRDVSVGERIAMEIVMARDTNRLEDVLT
jgi:5-formaminoimidazole-4-carboxamide-1-(beta)-D-ribofuranosyl 5'-monophosphate synthetase